MYVTPDSDSHRFKLVAGVFLILMKDEHVLLARRFQTGYADGWYSLPAGHIDGDEPLIKALIREAKEEVGVTLQPEDCQFVHTLHLRTNRESVNYFFVAKKWQGEPQICEPNKCDDLQWASIAELPEKTLHYIKIVLGHYQNGVLYSELGWDTPLE